MNNESIKSCYLTLILLEKGSFPDATCKRCLRLKYCLKNSEAWNLEAMH